MERPLVFIGSSTDGLPTASKVKKALSNVADVRVWNDEGMFGLGAGTFESLVNKVNDFDFAVLLMTPDDLIAQTGQHKFKPRDNVLIEFGLFVGALGRERAFAMIPFHELASSLHIPTDLAGVAQPELEPSKDPPTDPKDRYNYNVNKGCEKIKSHIIKLGRRSHLEIELGVLYRLINAFTFPHYENVHVKALRDSKIRYNMPQETFDDVSSVINFLSDLFEYYVYPHLKVGIMESMRVYFAYYLGDGIDVLPFEVNVQKGYDPRKCWDVDSDGNKFAGEFIIGLANPAESESEHNWRVGRAIKGYRGLFRDSMCAQVFDEGKPDGSDDVRKTPQGKPNYKTPNELSFYCCPVEWRSEVGAGRIGIITISSSVADKLNDELKAYIRLLANAVGYLFSLYAVQHKKQLEEEGRKAANTKSMHGFPKSFLDTEDWRRFVIEVIGLRREIAGHFENYMSQNKIHAIIDKELHCVSYQ